MKEYDFLIIGSGLAGLASGYILAKEGYSVCILEKNRQFGGNLQTFARDKSVFDTGVHYMGGLDKGQNLYKYFTYLGLMDQLKLQRMDENGFDRITFKDDPIQYPHPIGHDRFIEKLTELFPQSKHELIQYCKTLQEVCNSISLYRLEESTDPDIPFDYLSKSAYEFIDETITDPTLKQVLAGSNMLYAGLSDKTTLYQHAVVVNSYIESAWKCVDGGSQITKILVKNIKDLGGELYNYSPVVKLYTADKKIQYAEVEDGEKYFARTVISNIHPGVTMDLINPGGIKETYKQRMQTLENGVAAFSLHLVFHPGTFPYLNHNYYHHHTKDVWNAIHYTKDTWPQSIMAITPATSRSGKYADSMTVWTYMRWEEVEKWAGTFNTTPNHEADRGEDYETFKADRTEKMMCRVEELFPGIRSKIRSCHTSTPLSYRDYIATPQGSMYGVIKDFNHPVSTFISPKTKLENLFLTGQNLSTHGILGVTISAVRTCAEFIGQNELIRKINAASGNYPTT